MNAETQEQRKLALTVARVGKHCLCFAHPQQALNLTQGSSRNRLKEIRTSIIKAMAIVEALIDFGEGDNIEDGVYDNGKYYRYFLVNRVPICVHLQRGLSFKNFEAPFLTT